MFVVIVGGGKVGAHLAKTLVDDGHKATLVEEDIARCKLLEELLGGVTIVCGDGDEPTVLDEANVRNADALVAATGHDEDNLVACLLGKREYAVPLTIARTNNPANDWLFTNVFGVDVQVSSTEIMSEVLRRVSVGDITARLRLRAEDLSAEEFVVPQDSPAAGKTLAELRLPGGVQVVAVIKGGRVIVPSGVTRIDAGDEVLILSKLDQETALRAAFGLKTPERR